MKQVWVTLLAAAALASCATDAPSEARPSSVSQPAAGRTASGPAPGGWRTEVWRDVQLEVPTDWVLGYAPMPDGDGALACGVGPLESSGVEDRPYVGRPGYGSDVCIRTGLDDLALTGEGVWFGSPLPEGEVESKSGLGQTTVTVGESRVTVAAYDDAVRQQVLGSVERVGRDDNGCPAATHVERGYPDEGYGEVLSFAVCVYERRDQASTWQRLWTTSLPTSRAGPLAAAVEGARPGEPCRTEEDGHIVLLRMTTDDPMGEEPLLRDLLVRPGGCPSLQQGAPIGTSWLRLGPEMVRPWAVPGVSSYVWSNGLPGSVARFFRPTWG